jgi:hypothetical protein
MNWTHVALFGWACCNAFRSITGFTYFYTYWSMDLYKRLELTSTFPLFIFFAYATVLRGGRIFEPLSSAAIADDFIDWLDHLSGGTVRAAYPGPTQEAKAASFIPHPNVTCGWTGHSEILRTLLALSAFPIVCGLTEVFSFWTRLGALMVCARKMAQDGARTPPIDPRPQYEAHREVARIVSAAHACLLAACRRALHMPALVWMLLPLTAALACGIALNLLLPHFQSEHGAGAFRPFGEYAELDLSAAGPFWAPFWATFGYYRPGELTASPYSSFLAPLVVWLYLLAVSVLCLNLLIAMFNASYHEAMSSADRVHKMMNVRRVMVFLVQHPIPAPFDVLLLPLQLWRPLWDWFTARQQRAADKRARDNARMRMRIRASRSRLEPFEASFSDRMRSGKDSRLVTLPHSTSSSQKGPSDSFDWRESVSKDTGTRRYLMERARGQTLIERAMQTRPFMYDKSLVFTRVEANAAERAALLKHQQMIRTTEERERSDQQTTESLRAIHRRLDLLDSRFAGAGTNAPGANGPETGSGPPQPPPPTQLEPQHGRQASLPPLVPSLLPIPPSQAQHGIAPLPPPLPPVPDDLSPPPPSNLWLLSALGMVSTKRELLDALVVSHDERSGLADVRLYRDGAWQTIMVDCQSGGQAHARTGLPRNGPAALVLRALAKLNGASVHQIAGRVGDALEDLTGGFKDKLYLRCAASQWQGGLDLGEVVDVRQGLLVRLGLRPADSRCALAVAETAYAPGRTAHSSSPTSSSRRSWRSLRAGSCGSLCAPSSTAAISSAPPTRPSMRDSAARPPSHRPCTSPSATHSAWPPRCSSIRLWAYVR